MSKEFIMLKKILLFCLLIIIPGCATPNVNDVVVYDDNESYNDSIFPSENTSVTNSQKPDNEKVNNESVEVRPKFDINLFKDKPEKLKQILTKPKGIVLDKKGNIYLIDQDNNKVLKFDSKGKYLLEWGSLGTEKEMFKEPKYVFITNDDKIIVSDTWNGRLQIFDTNGKYLKQISESFFGPKGILLKDQDIYLADTGNHCIKIINKMGKVIKVIGKRGENDGEFNEPTGMTFDDKGNLYIVDSKNNRIEVFDSKDNFLKSWKVAKWTNKEEGKESWLVFYKGKIYMTDPITYTVRVFDKDGKEKAPFFKDLNLPGGLFLYKDTLYVVDSGTPKVMTKKL